MFHRVDEAKPYAEFWFGTHPAAPSFVAKVSSRFRLGLTEILV